MQTAEGSIPAHQQRQEKLVTGAGYPDQASQDVLRESKCPPSSNINPRGIAGMKALGFFFVGLLDL